jgi:hypothetical protein
MFRISKSVLFMGAPEKRKNNWKQNRRVFPARQSRKRRFNIICPKDDDLRQRGESM